MSELTDKLALPTHIGFIMDGNGRWAKQQNRERNYGHEKGAENVATVARLCTKKGVKFISLYAFSTENWSRPKLEINGIFGILSNFFKKQKDEFMRENARVLVSGDYDELPKKLVGEITDLIALTANNTALTINVCLNYGSLREVASAYNKMAAKGIHLIGEKDIFKYLYCPELPPVDLVIRTSGEMRLSNFMLLQSAYAELYFTDCYWPDFDSVELDRALEEYSHRKRRFGKA